MADPMTVMAIASTAMAVYGSIYEGKKKAEAARMQASLYQRSADEARRKLAINIDLINQEAEQLSGTQLVKAGGQGKALQGSVLDIVAQTKARAAAEILKQQSITEFEIANMHLKSNLEEFYGDTAETAGYIKGASGLMEIGGYAASIPGKTNTGVKATSGGSSKALGGTSSRPSLFAGG